MNLEPTLHSDIQMLFNMKWESILGIQNLLIGSWESILLPYDSIALCYELHFMCGSNLPCPATLPGKGGDITFFLFNSG